VAFKADELTTQILPIGPGLWACPESTITKGKPCDNTKSPCPDKSVPPGGPGCGGGSAPGGPRPPKKAEGPDRDALVLLQAQLRDRMAQGSAAGL
jgi:hypothetical protein